MKLKWIGALLCLAFIAVVPWTAMAAEPSGLTDLSGHWSEAQVTKAVETGWINGYPDGTFRPEGTVSRAEFTKMALAADRLIPGSENAKMYENDQYQFGRYLPETGSPAGTFQEELQKPFTDMNTHWLTAQGWTKIALNYGMLVSEDYAHANYAFRPDKAITRYEMAIILDRMLGLVYPATEDHVGESTGFADDPAMKDWQKGYVIEARKAGVLQGYPDGSFHGERTATRAEAVTMVQNALDYMEQGIDETATIRMAIDGNHWVEAGPQEQGTIMDGKNRIFTGYHWDREVPGATLQIIDGKIYVPLLRCVALHNAENRVLGDDLAGEAMAQWAPVHQGLVFQRGQEAFLFFAGTERVAYGSFGELYVEGADHRPLNLSAPPRMLYGQLMVGLEPVKSGDEARKHKFPYQDTVIWDPAAKEAILDMADIVLPNS